MGAPSRAPQQHRATHTPLLTAAAGRRPRGTRAPQHPPGGRLQLLDLPDSLLVAVAQQLPALQDLLRLEQACRRWRGVCAGPSPLWRVVSITIPKSKLRGMPKEQRNKEANRLLRDVGW